jgi:aryl-alcohol dehydrogenase-like predicted oxidoreductase
MQTRRLGRTSARVSALGFGCMGLVGWYGERDDGEALETVHAAIDAGIDHFDTAGSYQHGENEVFLGRAIRGRREQVFLASSYGVARTAFGAQVLDNRPSALRTACEESLRRLHVEVIDLFYLHRIDPKVPIEESVGALAALIASGKIRHIGLSNYSADILRRASLVDQIAAVQCEYSVWMREAEQTILPACRELGVSLVAYAPLARGFLAGQFATVGELPKDDIRRLQPRFQDANLPFNREIAAAFASYAKDKRCTPAQLALAWVLAQGQDVVTIPGTKRRARLNENLGALNVSLSRAECEDIASRVAALAAHEEPAPRRLRRALDQ